MRTRFFARKKPNEIVRRCRKCGIRDTDIPFLVMRDTKSGRYYKHCLCVACYGDRRQELRRKWYLEHREHSIRCALKWNREHRERYNSRRRKQAELARRKETCSYAGNN
jgi:hypothetical protein